MSKTLTLDEALKRIRGAFAPLTCVAEDWDYEHRIRLKVLDPTGDPLITVEELLQDLFTDPPRLDWMLREIASRVKAKGFALDNYPPQ